MVERWATVNGESVVRRGGVNVRPRAAMLHEGPSLSSSSSGTMRTILPSLHVHVHRSPGGEVREPRDLLHLLLPSPGSRAGSGAAQTAESPPSTYTIWPVMKLDSSEASRMMGPTSSYGSPRRRIGISAVILA